MGAGDKPREDESVLGGKIQHESPRETISTETVQSEIQALVNNGVEIELIVANIEHFLSDDGLENGFYIPIFLAGGQGLENFRRLTPETVYNTLDDLYEERLPRGEAINLLRKYREIAQDLVAPRVIVKKIRSELSGGRDKLESKDRTIYIQKIRSRDQLDPEIRAIIAMTAVENSPVAIPRLLSMLDEKKFSTAELTSILRHFPGHKNLNKALIEQVNLSGDDLDKLMREFCSLDTDHVVKIMRHGNVLPRTKRRLANKEVLKMLLNSDNQAVVAEIMLGDDMEADFAKKIFEIVPWIYPTTWKVYGILRGGYDSQMAYYESTRTNPNGNVLPFGYMNLGSYRYKNDARSVNSRAGGACINHFSHAKQPFAALVGAYYDYSEKEGKPVENFIFNMTMNWLKSLPVTTNQSSNKKEYGFSVHTSYKGAMVSKTRFGDRSFDGRSGRFDNDYTLEISFIKDLLRNKQLTEENINTLISTLPKGNYDEVRALILSHPNTPDAHLRPVYEQGYISKSIIDALADNPNLCERGVVSIFPHFNIERKLEYLGHEHVKNNDALLYYLASEVFSSLRDEAKQESEWKEPVEIKRLEAKKAFLKHPNP